MAYRENHIASAFYLARWAGPDGRVITIRVPTVTGVPRKPRRVGFRANFWGRDPHVRTAMETRIGKIEDLAARAISRVADRWPPTTGSEEWLAVAYLVALHFLPCSALVAEGP